MLSTKAQVDEHCRESSTQLEELQSDLECVVAEGNKIGYYIVARLMHADRCFVPNRRPRWYLCGFQMSVQLNELSQAHEDHIPEPMEGGMQSFITNFYSQALALRFEPEEFMFDDDDEMIGWELSQIKSKDMEDGKEKAHLNWPADHMLIFKNWDIPWPPAWGSDLELADDCRSTNLTMRMQEIVWFEHKRWENQLANDKDFVAPLASDLNMSLGYSEPINARQPVNGKRSMPCIIQSSVMWCFEKRRVFLGRELLRLQGCLVDVPKTVDIPWRKLIGLAGNAFCAFKLVGIVSAAVTEAPWEEMFALQGCDLIEKQEEDEIDGEACEEDEDGQACEEDEDDASSALEPSQPEPA